MPFITLKEQEGDNMQEKIIADLLQILIIYGVFACAFISNVLLSIRFNTKILDEKFNRKRLFDSLLNAIAIILGTLALVLAIDLLMMVSGLDKTQIGDVVTIGAVLGTIGIAIVKYIKEAFETLTRLLTTIK